MTKTEFLNYLAPPEQGAARRLLPEGNHSLEEWRQFWIRILNSPAN